MRVPRVLVGVVAVALVGSTAAFGADLDVISIDRISEAPGGIEADGQTLAAAVAGDRFVALDSEASNLVPDDTNNVSDVFVLDLETGAVERVSVTSDGAQADGQSYMPAIDASGRYVAFTSEAPNLGDPSCAECADVFLHDRHTGETRHLSAVADPATDGLSSRPRISADGKWVVFVSAASGLVAGDTNGVPDVFLYEVATGELTRVSTTSTGAQAVGASLAADVSAEGDWVAFTSLATLVPHTPDPTCVDIEGDTCRNIYIRHRASGRLTLVTRDTNGNGPNGSSYTLDFPSKETTGGWILALASDATDLVPAAPASFPATVDVTTEVFVAENRAALTTPDAITIERYTAPESAFPGSLSPAMSPDGRFVVFEGEATDGGGSLFVADRTTGLVRRLIAQARSTNRGADFLIDARDITFVSASPLVADDANLRNDAFLTRWTAFLDIVGNFFEAEIRWLAEAKITLGCTETGYCPRKELTRAQAASLLARFLELPPSASDAFSDDDGSVHEGAINALADEGVTFGCAPGLFCPDRTLTRGQLASLLVRALGLSGDAPDAFGDDDGSVHEGSINLLAERGVTQGCTVERFCPLNPVRRDQMAGFIFRAAGP